MSKNLCIGIVCAFGFLAGCGEESREQSAIQQAAEAYQQAEQKREANTESWLSRIENDSSVLHPIAVKAYRKGVAGHVGTSNAKVADIEATNVREFGEGKWKVDVTYDEKDESGERIRADGEVTLRMGDLASEPYATRIKLGRIR